MIRKIITAAVIVLTIAGGIIAVGVGVAAAGSAPPSCTSLFGHDAVQVSHATGFWTKNAAAHGGCGYQGQEHIHCLNGVTIKSEVGGLVVKEQLADTAKCPTGPWQVVKAGWRELLPGGPVTYWYFSSGKAGNLPVTPRAPTGRSPARSGT